MGVFGDPTWVFFGYFWRLLLGVFGGLPLGQLFGGLLSGVDLSRLINISIFLVEVSGST